VNEPSRRTPKSHSTAARYLPAFAAVAVVGAVVIAGVAGGLGGGEDAESGRSSLPSSSVAPTSAGVPPSTQAVVVETTDAPLVTTSLGQPLGYGSAGEDVLALQERLTELAFFVGPIDGQFGSLTQKAVWAFEKLVMLVPRDEATGVVTDEMWQQMQRPMRIEPRRWNSKGQTTVNHTEVYLPEQVVVFFQDDEPVVISHMSSGTGEEWREEVTIDVGEYGNQDGTEPLVRGEIGVSVTPGGIYSYDRMIEGLRQSALGGMWNPAYFNYGIAIHGAMNVPLEPASHGCIRVPLKVGELFHSLVDVGDNVWVWDGVKEPEFYGAQVPTFNRIDPDYSTTTTSSSTTVPDTEAPTTAAPTAPPVVAPTPTRPPPTQPPATQPPATQPPATPVATTTTTLAPATTTAAVPPA